MRPDSAAPVLALDAAARTYGDDWRPIHALRPTTLTIAAHDHIAVIGRSGSGKSTLLNLMGLLLRPTGGRVLVDGIDVTGLDDRRVSALRGEALGFVFQSFHLLAHRTVAENVELPLVYASVPSRRRRELVSRALARVGLAQRSDARPGELSGGQRQRVAIARAVARTPRIMLCDEPTGNLDTKSASTVCELLDEINQSGVAVLVATHNPEVASHARRTLLVSDGVVCEA